MATRNLLLWFEKRRKTKTLSLAQQQITQAMSTVEELDAAVKCFSEGNKTDMNSAIDRLFSREVEIDGLRRATLEDLSNSELPDVYREDLKRLVNDLDEFADQVKDSARSLKVLSEAEKVPKPIMAKYLEMSKNLVESIRSLRACIETLGTSPEGVKVQAERVGRFEEAIDGEYLEAKMLFVKHGGELEATTLLAMRDLLDYMERASDTCARTADYLRTLAATEGPESRNR